MQFGDQEIELLPPPRYDIEESYRHESSEEINEVYQIPVSQIPDLQFEIADGEIAEPKRIYSHSKLIPRGKGELQNPPCLHKYSDIQWNKVQSLQWKEKDSTILKCETVCYPPWDHIVTLWKKRYVDILETSGIEFYRETENQYAFVKKIESDIEETLISKDEVSQFVKNIKENTISSSSLQEKRIKDAMNDVNPSNIQKEAQRDLQDLSRQITSATKEAEFFMSPPRSSVNMIFNDSIDDRNRYFLEKGIIYRGNVILRHIISLAKYTKFNINFFGANNEKYKIALGDARDVVKRMELQTGVARLYSLFDLIGIARIVLPGDKLVFQKKILEPSTPSPELRTDQASLQSAGSGQT